MEAIFLILIALMGLIFIVILIRILNKSTTRPQKLGKSSTAETANTPQSSSGFYTIDARHQQQLQIGFYAQGLIEANQAYGLLSEREGAAAYKNRYTRYWFDLDARQANEPQKYLPLTVHLKRKQLFFPHSNNVTFARCEDRLIGCEFIERWSNEGVALEQAYADFKQHIHHFYQWDMKIYHALDEVRYHKGDYTRVLEEEGYCIAPEYLSFEEFKRELSSEDFYGLDVCFYLDEVVIDVNYNQDFSAEISIYLMDGAESHLSYMGADDVELMALTEEQKATKAAALINQRLQQRRELEVQARAQGYRIDEQYGDPFLDV